MESVMFALGELNAQITSLINQNDDNKKQILALEKRLSEREDRIKELEEISRKVSGNEERIKNLEEKCNTSVKNNEKLQKNVRRLEQQQQQQIENANEKFKKGEKLQHVLNSAILKNAFDHERSNQVEQITSRLDSVDKSVEKIDHISSRLDSVSKAVEGCAKDAFDKVFSVKLNHASPLAKNIQARLNTLEKTFCPSPSVESADYVSFKPECDGVYALNVEVCQTGDGVMSVFLRSEQHVSRVGRTTGHMLETSVMKVKKLSKGQKHWIEVKVLQGQPSVNWCNFSGFLIAREPSSTGLHGASK